jgi:hypothetical protein
MWLEGVTLMWLMPLAWHDLRYRSVPHMALIALPCLFAAMWATLSGAWPVAGLGALAVVASERYRLRTGWIRLAVLAGALLASAILVAWCGASLPGAFGILGFWLVYELGWWAGADALAAITLALLWPDVRLLVALAVGHLALALAMCLGGRGLGALAIGRPRRLADAELERHGAPGLPALVLAVTVLAGWHWVAAAGR